MAKKGYIPVKITRHDARVLSYWLLEQYQPIPPSALSGERDYSDDFAFADALGRQLGKAANRKRSTEEFTIKVERNLAEWLAKTNAATLLHYRASRSVISANEKFAKAANRRRGRPKLKKDELADIISGRRSVVERHRFRIRIRENEQALWEDWWRDMQERGKTALTYGVPSPNQKRT